MRIKLPPKDTSCIITSFYVIGDEFHHDELDFEFYGGNSLPYQLQTNVFANGVGGREQKVALWFDPTADFHDYQILWNQHHVMFSVDGIPIRVFKNNTVLGVDYPWRPMQVEATIWYADWACDVKPDLSKGPYVAEYQSFDIAGCPVDDFNPNGRELCYSPRFWWNTGNRWQLDPHQEQEFQNVRAKHISYDYCRDRARYPVVSPECQPNSSLL
ncbi:unnamed protein product [Linum tenue]|uniref:Xyloglucan endotransglucosylase/hydrolase n=1 Tax=Linum tenue TaxID=586396 RepID=A0AAV0RLF2_9ROSI|nr:unnamed protein product [Linum tenue]